MKKFVSKFTNVRPFGGSTTNTDPDKPTRRNARATTTPETAGTPATTPPPTDGGTTAGSATATSDATGSPAPHIPSLNPITDSGIDRHSNGTAIGTAGVVTVEDEDEGGGSPSFAAESGVCASAPRSAWPAVAEVEDSHT